MNQPEFYRHPMNFNPKYITPVYINPISLYNYFRYAI